MPGSGAMYRLIERPEAEPAPRQQLPPLLPDHLEIRKIHQIQEIDGGDVVDDRLLAAQTHRFGEFQHRLPQMRVIGDDDPRRWRAQMMHQPQRAVDILEHADGVGNHDVIERPFDGGQRRRILDVAEHEIQIGIQRVGLGDDLGAEIDADAVGRLQRGEQMSAAAAQFQHPLAGRNQEPHELAIVLVIGGIEFAPAILLVEAGSRRARAVRAFADCQSAGKRRIGLNSLRPRKLASCGLALSRLNRPRTEPDLVLTGARFRLEFLHLPLCSMTFETSYRS